MLAMDVWCFSKSTIRVDLEKHQTRLHYWGNSLCNFEEAPLQFWVFLLCTKQRSFPDNTHCIRPAVPEGKTYPDAELILTPPATPEPVLTDEGMVSSSMLNEYKSHFPTDTTESSKKS